MIRRSPLVATLSIAGLLAMTLSGCVPPAPETLPDTTETPVVDDGAPRAEDGYDVDELTWFSWEPPDPSIRDFTDQIEIISAEDLETEPDDLEADDGVGLPELDIGEGPDLNIALDGNGPGQWAPPTPICEMFSTEVWREWTGDPDAYSVVLNPGEDCAYFTAADLHRMSVTLEIGGPGYVAVGDGWEETIIWDFIPAFWKKADPKPFEARLFASTPGIMIIVVLSSRDPGLDWPDLKAFQERVATDMWGNLS